MYCACSNARARGAICDYGGPLLAETDSPGGPLVAGDHLFRDRTLVKIICLKAIAEAIAIYIATNL